MTKGLMPRDKFKEAEEGASSYLDENVDRPSDPLSYPLHESSLPTNSSCPSIGLSEGEIVLRGNDSKAKSSQLVELPAPQARYPIMDPSTESVNHPDPTHHEDIIDENSNLKLDRILSPLLPAEDESSGEEDMMNLFCPPVSVVRNRNRVDTVVTAQERREEELSPHHSWDSSNEVPHPSLSDIHCTEDEHKQNSQEPSPVIKFVSSNADFVSALQLSFDVSPETTQAHSTPVAPVCSEKVAAARPLKNQQPQQQETPLHEQLLHHQHQGASTSQVGMHTSYPYPLYNPHPYSVQMMGGLSASSQQSMMPPGVMSIPGYGYPQWGSPPGQYFAYPSQPSIGVPPQHYPMYPPTNPGTADRTTPTKYPTTPGKRKDRRKDPNLTVETADVASQNVTNPTSPPSSKKKRDGPSLGVPTWPTSPSDNSRDGMGVSYTPLQGSRVALRTKRETPSRTPRNSSLDENFSFGATPGRDLFRAPSWSPGAMGKFFEEEGMLHGDTGEAASLEAWELKGPSRDIGITKDSNPFHSSPNPSHSYMTSASPSRTGITIRGSPISSKALRSDNSRNVPLKTINSTRKSIVKPRQAVAASWPTAFSGGNVGAFRFNIGNIGIAPSAERKEPDSIEILRSSPVTTRNNVPSNADFPHPTALQSLPVIKQRALKATAVAPASQTKLITPATVRLGCDKENLDTQRSSHPCNCKKSKCLKLYCECFAAEKYCDGCKCTNCQNNSQYGDIRDKAITDTKAKNPNAFQPRITKTETEHITGCKCKKSACLKKYCECFEAGVVCGENCKCSGCQNFMGSRALMDRRHKMKDVDDRAEITTTKSSSKAWRGSMSDSKLGRYGQSPLIHDPTRPIMGSPMPSYLGQPMYYHHHVMMGQSPVVYQHGMVHNAPPYSAPRTDESSVAGGGYHPRDFYPQHPIHSTPKTPSVRRGFDPNGRRNRTSVTTENRESFFGPNVPSQTRTSSLSIFSYLSNEDLFNASIVSKSWSNLAFDDELWQPVSGHIRL